MSRAVYRFRNYTLAPDIRPEAEPWSFAMQCATCGVTSPAYRDAGQGPAWAERHLKANAGHLDYRERVTRPYTFEPGAWL